GNSPEETPSEDSIPSSQRVISKGDSIGGNLMYLPAILSISVLSLIVAFFFARQVLCLDTAAAEIQVILNLIKKGAEGFLRLMRACAAHAWSQRCRMAKTFAAS